MIKSSGNLTVGFLNQEDSEKEVLFIHWSGLPVSGGGVQTEIFTSESPDIKEKLLQVAIDVLLPVFTDPVVAEGIVYQDGLAPVLEKLRWIGPELAEDY